MRVLPILVILLTAMSPVAHADVVASSPAGFVSEHQLTIAATRARVFKALTDEGGGWGDPEHSYSGNAANLSIDPRPGGCFCEKLPDGAVVHMTVVFIRRDAMLRMIGGLGPLQAMAVSGSMTFEMTDAANGTTQLRYRYAVGGYAPDGMSALATPVDQVQLGQLERLRRYIETGHPEIVRAH